VTGGFYGQVHASAAPTTLTTTPHMAARIHTRPSRSTFLFTAHRVAAQREVARAEVEVSTTPHCVEGATPSTCGRTFVRLTLGGRGSRAPTTRAPWYCT
jgi:hypothetical protein